MNDKGGKFFGPELKESTNEWIAASRGLVEGRKEGLGLYSEA